MANAITTTNPAQGTVIEAQVDWLTAGWNEGQGADRAEAWAFARAQRERREGAVELPFRLMGFQGWTVGRIRYGRRDGDVLLQLSGDLAEQNLDTVVGESDRISRVDLAVTVRLERPDPYLGELTFAQAVTWREEHPRAALPSIIQDGDGGCTAYVGRRTSDSYLRVYNKEAESKASGDAAAAARYARCWRYELECKGGRSWPMSLATSVASPRAPFIQQQLFQHCTRHGIVPAFPPSGGYELIPGFRRRSDYESRLGWLKRSVNPAIVNMLEVGDRADILEAVGLGTAKDQTPAGGHLP